MKGKVVLLSLMIILVISCNLKNDSPIASSKDPLTILQEGNKRYLKGHPIHPDETLERLRELKTGQHPFVVVVSCSDSRVPPELIFDQGLCDIFVIRTAGNVIGDYELGSIEYAVEHLKCKLIVVMGHQNCGAVKAFIENHNEISPNHIQSIIDYLKNETEEEALEDSLKTDVGAAVKANVLHGVHLLSSSEPLLAPLVQQKEIRVVGAIYSLDDGSVSFIKE